MIRCLFVLLFALAASCAARAAVLTGSTSHPNYSVFVRGEPVTLTFAVSGLQPGQAGGTLAVKITDVNDNAVLEKALSVTGDAAGKWQGSMSAPSDRLGFFKVTAKLSSGETLPALGSRGSGYLTYMVVIDPKDRIQPGEDAHFGMQGGFTSAFDARPYLGVHWVLGDYSWGREEPDHAGQFAAKRQELRANPDQKAQALREAEHSIGILPLPTLLNGTPKWAVEGGKLQYTTGVIKDLDACRNYCREVGRAMQEDYPWLKRHVFQITWEPVYPWGFNGTDEDLIRDYEVAYPALHEADPKAFVIGPTGGGISPGDLDWNRRLLQKGLGKYLDGFAIHPYIGEPPEQHNLVQNIRTLKEMIRTYVGHDLPLFGTEQGWATGGDHAKELSQAMWLTRTYLIMLGEGFKVNTAFYFADYPSEPGFGFFYNLNPKIPFGTNMVSPKPMAAAYAAMTMLLEGHRSLGAIEWLGQSVLGYAYQLEPVASPRKAKSGAEPEITLALWDYGDSVRKIKLPVGVKSVEVIDWMGNGRTVATPNESLEITLGPEPQYIRGVSPQLWGSGAQRPLLLQPAHVTAFPGDAEQLLVKIAATQKKPSAGTLRIEFPTELGIPAVERAITLGPAATLPIHFTLPGDVPYGAFPVRATVSVGEQLIGFTTAMVRVQEPLSVERVVPAGSSSLRITVRNHRNAPCKGTARLHLSGVPDTRRDLPFQLTASGSTELIADFNRIPLDPAVSYRLEVTLSATAGGAVTGSFPASFVCAPHFAKAPHIDGDLSEWKNVPAISLVGRERLVRQPQLYRGRKDLSAEVRYAWDAKALYLAVDVTDDVFLQDREGFNTWQQDCLQVAVDTQPGKAAAGAGNLLAEAGQRTVSEIDLALTHNGPEAYRTITPDAALPVGLISARDLPLAVRRRDGGAIYEAAIPWTTLGMRTPPPAGALLGVALTVNDADDPHQRDPKAIGLFGGITPVKDPTLFGPMLLSAQAPAHGGSPAPAAGRKLELAGFLGQSENPPAAPLPWTGCVGAMSDSANGIWTIAGNTAYRFEHGRLNRTLRLPAAVRAMRGDGSKMLCLTTDDRFLAVDITSGKASVLADAHLPDGKGPRDIALDAKGAFYALDHEGNVFRWTQDGKERHELLHLTPGKKWWYCSIGIDPKHGDLLVGSYYPDNRIYRFDASGKPLGTIESSSGYATLITDLRGSAWMVNVGGGAAPVTKSASDLPAITGRWGYYPTGIAADSDGTWIACAQGLLLFDSRGNPVPQRAGGLSDPGLMAANSTGTVLALVERGQRFVRLSADDPSDAPLSSNANEPWRVGNGWTGRAAGLVWDGAGYLVLDATAKCLWRFDPDHTAWGEKPWVRLMPEGTFPNPRALAAGDAFGWVLDGTALRRLDLSDFSHAPAAVPWPAGLQGEKVVALAADRFDRVFAATATGVVAMDATGKQLWTKPAGFAAISGLAAMDGAVAVADRSARRIILLDAATGDQLTAFDATAVPGGFEPAGLTAAGPWLFAADTAGHRIVQLRLR